MADEQDAGGGGLRALVPRWPWVVATIALCALTGVLTWVIAGSGTSGTAGDPSAPAKGPTNDSFGREVSDGLGRADNGRPWNAASGIWSVADGVANGRGGDGPAIALVDTGSRDHLVDATLVRLSAGAGLIAGYQGPNNFISATVAPESASILVRRFAPGGATELAKVAPTNTREGTRVGLRVEGQKIVLYVGGREVRTVTDRAVGSGTRVGLLVGPAGRAAFDDVIALPLGRSLAAGGKPDAGSGRTSTVPPTTAG